MQLMLCVLSWGAQLYGVLQGCYYCLPYRITMAYKHHACEHVEL